jgi:hypothetical protein
MQRLIDLLTSSTTPLWFALIAPTIVFAGVLYTALATDKRELIKLRREQIIKAQADIFFNTKILDDIFVDLRARAKDPKDVLAEMDQARRELYRATMVILSVGGYHIVDAARSVSATYGNACNLVVRNKRPAIDIDYLVHTTKTLTAAVRFELGVRNRITIRERVGKRIQDRLVKKGTSVVHAVD